MDTTKTKNIQKVFQSENKKLSIIKDENEALKKKELDSFEEKAYLEGELHFNESSSLNSKNIKNMEQVTVKPRETYLKEKINKIIYNKNLINNIQKDMDVQINEIKIEIEKEKVLINKKQKNVDIIMDNIKNQKEKKLIKYSEIEYKLRKKHKVLKELREEQNILKAKLNKLTENEELLKSEGYMNLNNSYEGITPFDKSIKEQEMKKNKNKRNDINERLKETNFRIEHLLKEEEENKVTKKEKLKNFNQSINKDKDIIEARAAKYLKESKERNKRLLNDIDKIVEKRKKEIEKKEKEDEDKKKELIDKFRKDVKKKERENLEKKKSIMDSYIPYRLKKLDKKEDDYRYIQYNKRYIETEENYINKIKMERKQKNIMVTSEDLKNFMEKIEITKEELKKEKEKRDLKEKEKFDACKNYKPNYISKTNKRIIEEMDQINNKEKYKKEKLIALNEKKKNVQVKIPEINEMKKKERMDLIVKLEKPILFQKKYTLKKQDKKKRVLLKERNQNSKKYEWLYKLEKHKIENLNNSTEIKVPQLIKKPKLIKMSYSFTTKNKDEINLKKINYLKELREKRGNEKKTSKSQQNSSEKKLKNKKEKNEKKENIIEKLNQAKEKVDFYERKASIDEKLLKINGGISNNPKLGKELSDLYINSIGAKLNVLKKIYDE